MSVPVGTILPYAGATAPADYLLCYGQAINRTTYSSLFSIIGTTYGSGDGSTTFNIPDLRGRVVAGQDDMGGTSANRLTGQSGGVDGDVLGGTGGLETHTLTVSQLASHTHDFQFTNMGRDSTLGQYVDQSNNLSESSVVFTTAATGGDGAHNNVQPTIILNYIIATGPQTSNYVAENGTDTYITESGANNYVTES
jgi:microcystin-dependent protein